MDDREHLDALDKALAREAAHQAREASAHGRLPMAEQLALGWAWPALKVDDSEPAGRGRTRWRLRPESKALLHDGIGGGDPVEVLSAGASQGGTPGWCVGSDERAAEIELAADVELPDRVIVRRRHDETTFRRYREALDRVRQLDTPLVRVLLGLSEPTPREEPVSLEGFGTRLNPAQRGAMELALGAGQVALVHGPPGTGKTVTIVEMLRALVAAGECPWALADSNAAVDHLTLSAARAGLRVVRLGSPYRIGAEAARYTLRSLASKRPEAAAISSLESRMSRLRHQRTGASRAELRELARERSELRRQAEDAVLASAEVIATTFGTLVRRASHVPTPGTAIVDEATQALEPAIWTAVPHVERLILVGDPHQLGPVVTSEDALLSVSLLERLVRDRPDGVPLPMLEVQHRMNAEIQGLVQQVYGEAYRPHPSVADQRLPHRDDLADLGDTSVIWVDTAGAGLEESRDPRTMSLYNRGEVRLVAAMVGRLRAAGVAADDIGVIAPYSAQVARLEACAELAGVEVATVNAFQGREKDVIVCSFVRCNDDADLGFVRDRRRLTVAVTRARRFLCLVGDSITLGTAEPFERLLSAVESAGALRSVWEPPWDEVLSDT